MRRELILTTRVATTVATIATIAGVAGVATVALPDGLGGDAHVVVLRELRTVQHCRPATH